MPYVTAKVSIKVAIGVLPHAEVMKAIEKVSHRFPMLRYFGWTRTEVRFHLTCFADRLGPIVEEISTILYEHRKAYLDRYSEHVAKEGAKNEMAARD
jgi:hypothetical protein